MTRRHAAAVVVILLSGCTHVQLRSNTLHQAQTVHEVHQQEVLDNLAMFTLDPTAVPFFTLVGAGTAAVSDTGTASTPLGWLRSGFQSVGLTLSAQRLSQENFTLAPISDPDKLSRMRCAYQAAVGYPLESGGCIDCCALARQWSTTKWTGRPAPSEDANWHCPDHCWPQPGWYGAGCKKQIPACVLYVGHFRDRYVWVSQAGADDFARLTLMILDFATAIPGSDRIGPTKSNALQEELTPPSQLPVRQNFFFPSPVPQLVIPTSPIQ